MITLHEILDRDKRPPSVTVYMICYNHAKYLDEAIHGVLMQKTNFPVNIVIHDDASTDKSAEIIRRYAAENPNITAILEETNFYQNGKSFLPLVIPHLTGKYIAYCECDDFWIDENKLQIQVDYMEANPDCIAVYANIQQVDKYSQPNEKNVYFKKTREGDYSKYHIYGVAHQLATCVTRNFWKFMQPEEINTYVSTKANGDEKQFVLCHNLGRVHFFSEQLSAYRHVTDEGDSASARMHRISTYDRFCLLAKQMVETYNLIDSLFGKKYRRIYIYVLLSELTARRKFHRSFIEDARLDSRYHLKNIPIYAYVGVPLYKIYTYTKLDYVYRGIRKIFTILSYRRH